ncbi:FKBP-type peptidyl-prolyl cis-trans isomerase [Cellulomonas bogoriensis]|uniref:Peptidyl-prolyl cis-trans isomerase n=1 Tax=Cellulomonas bogoriensis 69B4 = DSM 16987 TaxID=1386082 RepID=A0A0A0C035_9CELL|nr:FKBP-type peptidyl-prolyl cis-trans isomerase [Cellulomonas bogoriensis]KGM13561.1 peptidylprolyl isomerase [Cellulomonas bogoriensis 69B4 = DSM 16987]
MRRLAAALIATTLLLAGCGTDEPEETTPPADAPDGTSAPSAEDLAAVEGVTVDGEVGSAPTMDFDQPFTVTNPVARVETPGTGEPLEDGQRLSIHYVAYDGDSGEQEGSTWEGDPDSLILGDPQLFPALNDVLTGESVGVRIVFAAPGIAMDPEESVPATVMAVEVIDAVTLPTRAEGEAVDPVEGLPEVTLDDAGAPSLEIPEGYEAPEELVAQELIVGPGEPVEAGQQVTFHYTGWTLDGEVFDSSWDRGQPFETMIGVGQVIPGWDEGLVGQTVGSQVLLVIPPDMAYGSSPEHELAEETLLFVVDILDAN